MDLFQQMKDKEGYYKKVRAYHQDESISSRGSVSQSACLSCFVKFNETRLFQQIKARGSQLEHVNHAIVSLIMRMHRWGLFSLLFSTCGLSY